MNPTGPQLRQLHDALLSAFPTRAELAKMVQFGLNQSLETMVPSGTLSDEVFALLSWVGAQGRWADLLTAALTYAPGNDQLRAAAAASLPDGDVGGFLQERSAQHRVPPPWPPTIPWSDFRRACQAISGIMLGSMKGNDPTLPIVPRPDIEQQVAQFLQSDKTFLVIVGESGMGKTQLLRSLITELAAQTDTAVVVYEAPMLDDGPPVLDRLDRELGDYLKFTRHGVLASVEKETVTAGQKLLILIDALNESCDPAGLVRDITNNVLTHNAPWIKVIMTCRPHAWQQARRKVNRSNYYQPPGSEQDFLQLGRFTPAEAAQAYADYRTRFHFQGPEFAELSSTLRTRLSDPLLLWMIAEISGDEKLPDMIPALDIDVVPLYIAHLMKIQKLDESDIAFLGRTLNPHLLTQGTCAGTVLRRELGQATEPTTTDAAHLENLLDAGILLESGSTIDAMVRYRYERFQDYYLGEIVYNHFAGRQQG